MPRYLLCLLLAFSLYLPLLSAGPRELVSTESDPDAFIEHCVNVINGDYCEAATDVVIAGPDNLILQRFYSTKDAVTGTQTGSWRILPQRFLVIGQDPSLQSCTIGQERFEWTSALVGERSGGIFPFIGWRGVSGITKDPLKIDIAYRAQGIVNTYAKEISGQTNHRNNLLDCKGLTCELRLGDGTKRVYNKVYKLPTKLLGEELTPLMASQVKNPSYYLLDREILPSGNQLCFSYDKEGHLTVIELKNKAAKLLSWLHLKYDFQATSCQVYLETSDARKLIYHFVKQEGLYQLVQVEGSDCIPVSYSYDGALVKKSLPLGRFVEINYADGKVKALKGPDPVSGEPTTRYTFLYDKNATEVRNIEGIKTRYTYDDRFQLIQIQHDDADHLPYRTEQRFWAAGKSNAGFLLAKTIGDGAGRIFSYRSFEYDKSGNVTVERLYGNLTGKQEVALRVSSDGKLVDSEDEECHTKSFTYSEDGYNLLTRMGDSKGNDTRYLYKPETNLLVKKFICDQKRIRNRTFHTYNEDAVCIRTVEDDECFEDENVFYSQCTERRICVISPKQVIPGLGLPEVIEERGYSDLKRRKEVLIKKIVNCYDNKAQVISCSTYDANDQLAFIEEKSYNSLGQLIISKDRTGKESYYTYDEIGNRITFSIPKEERSQTITYDFCNQPIMTFEKVGEEQLVTKNCYDRLGRKSASTDCFGNTTLFTYDAFHRLVQVIYPEVLGEDGLATRPTFKYAYDIFGNVVSLEDPKGFVVRKFYNLRGSPTKILYPDGSCELFKYDTEGSLHRSLTRDQIVTVYEYDYLGRSIYEETSTTHDKGISSFIKSHSRKYNGFRCICDQDKTLAKEYQYDPAGRIASIREYGSKGDRNNPGYRLTDLFYDALGRLHQKHVWFGVGAKDYSVECYGYDSAGNTIEKRIQDAEGNVLLKKGCSYDENGHCIEEYGLEDDIKTVFTRTVYNPAGEALSYFNGLGQETKVFINNAYQNALGQKVLRKTVVNPLGVETHMEFDALSRVCAISKTDPSGTLLSSQKILYDPLGNKACEIHDQIVDGIIVSSQTSKWVYGPMGRLEEEIQAVGTSLEQHTHYTYNTLGKLTQKTLSGASSPITYTYNKDGRLHKIEASSSKDNLKISNHYSYDDKGNILSAQSLYGTSIKRTYDVFDQVIKEEVKEGREVYQLHYSYDKKGRLTQIVLPDSSKIIYQHDALFGRAVKRLSAEGKVLYRHKYETYDMQGKLLKETYANDMGASEYAYDLGGKKLSQKNPFFHEQCQRDGLGHILEIEGNTHREYGYNFLSQLISEKKESTHTYLYDSLDNRIQIDNDLLSYNSRNRLTSFAAAQFSYDVQGNLLKKVLDNEETRFESNVLSQLVAIEKADQTQLTFSYDAFGRLLAEKEFNIKGKNKQTLSTTRFLYLGNQEIGTLSLSDKWKILTLKVPGLDGDKISPLSIAFELKDTVYIPLHDLEGNVSHLIDAEDGELVEKYEYSAFGKETIFNRSGQIQMHSAVDNPWRFAEKRHDPKSGLILFGLRLYDPSLGRWISQDPAGLIDGPNLYAYLHNNPINSFDRFGLATETTDRSQFESGYMYSELETHCYCEKHRTCKRGGDIGQTISSALPKITYDETFERHFRDVRRHGVIIRNFYDDSTYYDLTDEGLSDLPDELGIGFVNGICNNLSESKAGARYLSKFAGGHSIHGTYNATHGLLPNLIECTLGLNHIATEPVHQLHKMWNSFFEKRSANAKFLMVCHSQGAIHVRNALLDYPPELRERISVVAIAPAAYIYRKTCAEVVHYVADGRDIVPLFDWEGGLREADTIIKLQSHPDAGFFDHEFMSPTYTEALRSRIRRFIAANGVI